MTAFTSEMNLALALTTMQSSVQRRLGNPLSLHGLSFTEFLVMNQLSRTPNRVMRRIDLAHSVGLSASGVTRLLAPMEKMGIVSKEPNPRDARVSFVKLTDSGASLYADALETFKIHSSEVFGVLTKDDQASLMGLCQALK